MRLSKMKLTMVLVFLLIFTCTFTSAVYSDSPNGWKGYGLFNISNPKVTIMKEDVNIELTKDKLHLNAEYVIRNTTNIEAKVTLGVPANGIERLSLMEKGYFIKWKKRSLESLQYEFDIDNQLPQENYWYVFNVTLNPAEARVLSISMDAAQQYDSKGVYTVGYFADRKLGYSNKAEKSTIYIKVKDFEPYNILSVKGLDPNDMGKRGEISLEGNESSIEAISIQHKAVFDQAIDRLMRSPMYKSREIALAFQDKNYDKASSLCDEYLKNPNDEQISKEQISLIKAESLRRLYKYERYLEIVEHMDYTKLYPAELKNKVYLDRVNVYHALGNSDKTISLSKELAQQTDEGTEYLMAWLEGNGYFNISEEDKANLEKENKDKEQASGQPGAIVLHWYRVIIGFPYTPYIMFTAGLLTGLLIRSGNAKRKKRKSMYVYRM